MSRLSGAKGRRNRSVSVYELPDHQDQDCQLAVGAPQVRAKGVQIMNLQNPRPRTEEPSAYRNVSFLTRVTGTAASLLLAMGIFASSAHAQPITSFLSELSTPLPTQTVSSQRWYEGGGLQRATLRQWMRASRRDQLATAAGWTIQTLGRDKVLALGMDGWRAYANNFVTCVNTAAAPAVMEKPVSELAAACSVLLEQ